MRAETGYVTASDGADLFLYAWQPNDPGTPRGVVHVAHGMAEHAARYERMARALTGAGYAVYANDHRGHGRTAKNPDDLGYFTAHDGWNRCMRDLVELVQHERDVHPGVPLVLFGHSMGSMMAQQFLCEHGGLLAGAILSGTSGKPPLLAQVGRVIARCERLRLGPRGRSGLLRKMTFDDFNRRFAPVRTPFDWLSRDDAEVDAYVDDPLCGFDCTTQLWIDMLDRLGSIARPRQQARIPKDLPIYIFSGARDPVGNDSKSVRQLVDAYRRSGLRQVEYRFYEGGRHEMLNEINRDEVTRDLLVWLEAALAKRERAQA